MKDYLSYEMKLRLQRNAAWDRHVECVLRREGCGGDATWAAYTRARDRLKRFTEFYALRADRSVDAGRIENDVRPADGAAAGPEMREQA